MNKNLSIKKIVAWAMLLVFTISITPKKYFHDIFFNHADESCDAFTTHQTKITNYKFSCGFVNTIATTPFTITKEFASYAKKIFYSFLVVSVVEACFYTEDYCFLLRGPPIV